MRLAKQVRLIHSHFLVTIAFLFLTVASFAQSRGDGGFVDSKEKFTPGYIVGLQNDTTKGFVMDRIDSELAHQIIFKATPASPSTAYTPVQLRGFGFQSGRAFESILAVEETGESAVFGKRTLRGKIDVVVYRKGRIGLILFLRNNETNRVVQLKTPQKMVVTGKDGRTYKVTTNEFIDQIKAIKNVEATPKIRFEEERIKKDIDLYNAAFSSTYPAWKYAEPTSYSYSGLMGVPIIPIQSGVSGYRVLLYRNRRYADKSKNISSLVALTYHYSTYSDRKPDHLVNIMPFGATIRSDPNWFRPYFRLGVGLGIYYGKVFLPFPNVLLAGGVEIEFGPLSLNTEIVPSILGGVVGSVGLTFR